MSSLRLDNWCFLPTSIGHFRMYDTVDERVCLITYGDIRTISNVPIIRIHSSCKASEIFKALDCDCADQLEESMNKILCEGEGLIFHLYQEGRGHGISKKINAVSLMQQTGLDTFESFETLNLEQDTRTYQCVVDILTELKVRQVRLITNNPRKIDYLKNAGISVVETIHTQPKIRRENCEYLYTKKHKLGHIFSFQENDLGNNNTLEEKNVIKFYYVQDQYGFLSNFSRHPIYLHEKIWMTSEHYYQAQKYKNTPDEEQIRLVSHPMEAKKIATEKKDLRRADWESIKDDIMREAIYAKFTQHPDLKEKLLATKNSILIEHTNKDNYWGDGGDGSGKNMLGKILMEIRSRLK